MNSMQKPLVSVIMPAYNAEKYISKAIASVQQQTIENWELIVIDDCSGDGTAEVVAGFAQADSRIRFLKNEQNSGVARTRNRGIEVCTGEYVAFLDSDDIWHPEKLECQIKCLQENNGDLSYTSYSIVDHMGKQQCPEVQRFPLTQHTGTHENEQQGQADTGDDVRVGHGDIREAQHQLAHFGLQPVDADGCHGAECYGNAGRQQGDQNRVAQQAQQILVPEQFHILLQRKALKLGDILAGIERGNDQHSHGDIQEDKDQDGNETICFLHTTTPSSSPPKRFMIPVHTKTSAISTRLRAAPKWGLLPCLNHFSMMSPIKMVSGLPSFWEM